MSATAEFICIDTYSGTGRIARDPRFEPNLLPYDTDDYSIGKTILRALSNSRTLVLAEEIRELFIPENSQKNYVNWYTFLKEKYGYKTKRSLFKNMKKCGIHLTGETIIISPSHHETLESWTDTDLDESDDVVIPLNSSFHEIGAALKLALGRCT